MLKTQIGLTPKLSAFVFNYVFVLLQKTNPEVHLDKGQVFEEKMGLK